MKEIKELNLENILRLESRKFLIAKSKESAELMVEDFIIRNETIVANYRILSVLDLANIVVESLKIYDNLELINDSQGAMLMYAFLVEETKNGTPLLFDFIPVESVSYKTAEVVYKTINIVRTGKIIGKNKVDNLIKNFEGYMLNSGFYDGVLILKAAHESLLNVKLNFNDEFVNATYVIFPDLRSKLSYLEEEIISLFSAKSNSEIVYATLKETIAKNVFKYSAYGYGNEVNLILNKIRGEKININDVAIYTSDGKYDNLIKAYFENAGIPVHFACGELLIKEDAVTLFIDILNFISNHYSISYLYRIMKNPALNSEYKCIDKLVNFKADKEHIKQFLNALDERTNEPLFSEPQVAFISDLLNLKIEDISSLLDDIEALVIKYTDESNEQKVRSFMNVTKRTIKLLPKDLPMSLKVLTTLDYMSNIAKGKEKPKNYVYVSRINSSSFLHRKHSFFIGLSANQINVKEVESPLLNDEEIKSILDTNYYVSLTKNLNKEIGNDFRSLLSTCNDGNIYLVASVFDSFEFKKLAKSTYFIEIEGIEDENIYNDYLKKDISFKEIINDDNLILSTEILDVIRTKKSFSPSALELLMKCPLHFIYNYSYKYDDIELDEYDGTYLRANELGTYAHALLEDYFNANMSTFNDVFLSNLHEESKIRQINNLPFDNEYTAINELDRIYTKVKQYLINYFAEETQFKVLACEQRVGGKYIYDKENNKSIYVSGMADRIDGFVNEDGNLVLRFIDYKTSNDKGFKSENDKGFKLQGILYTNAAKEYALKNRDEIESKVGKFKEVDLEATEFIYEMLYGVKYRSILCNKEKAEERLNNTLNKYFELLECPTISRFNELYGLDNATIAGDFAKGHCEYCPFVKECAAKLLRGDMMSFDFTGGGEDA